VRELWGDVGGDVGGGGVLRSFEILKQILGMDMNINFFWKRERSLVK